MYEGETAVEDRDGATRSRNSVRTALSAILSIYMILSFFLFFLIYFCIFLFFFFSVFEKINYKVINLKYFLLTKICFFFGCALVRITLPFPCMYFFVSQNYNYLFLYCSFLKNFSVFKKINYKVIIFKYF